MKILVITSPDHNTETIIGHFAALNQHVDTVDSIDQAIKALDHETYNTLFIPLTGGSEKMRDTINTLRRHSRDYLYIITLSGASVTLENTAIAGSNAGLADDAITTDALKILTNNALRLFALIKTIGNNAVDFPSAGGIIARSAFNQLFLSALDRGNRYSEQSSVLNITLDNYDELFDIGGHYVADHAIAVLSKTLVDIRRQSDIIGQIQKHSFSLLLQMPKTPSEPIEAAKRFAETLANNADLQNSPPTPMGIKVSLIALPTGTLGFDSFVVPQKTSA